jgi:hypothetical protein
MSDQDQDLTPVVPGLEVTEAPAKVAPKVDLPEVESIPAAILSGTTGEGLVLGAAYAVKREKDDNGEFKRAENAVTRLRGYVAPQSGGVARMSPGNQFGVYGARELDPAMIRTILENADEAEALADFLEEHAG